jgi:hypothetical protein
MEYKFTTTDIDCNLHAVPTSFHLIRKRWYSVCNNFSYHAYGYVALVVTSDLARFIVDQCAYVLGHLLHGY